MKLPIIILDLETTGTNPKEDRIVQLAMIKLNDDGSQTVKNTLVNPGIPIPAQATECHGITDEQVKDAPTFAQLAKGVLAFIEGHDMGGYNSNSFDIPMLYAEFCRAGLVWDTMGVNFVDACNIFKRKEERTLGAAVKFYTGEEHVEDAHDALADCAATVKVLQAQLIKYQDITEADNKALGLYCNYDKERYDIDGCFTKDEEGRWVLNFGKNKGKLAAGQRPYLEWMAKSSFLPDTLRIVNSILFKRG